AECAAACQAAYDSGAIVDVEFSSGLLSDPARFSDRRRVIVSRHTPFGLPDDRAELASSMAATGAAAVKIVAGAPDLRSSLGVAATQKSTGVAKASVFPMGPASAPGRILSAILGGSLVYGSVEGRTAPGQLALADLLDTYRVRERRPVESLFGIVGA